MPVRHKKPADDTFSPEGKAAWDDDHNVALNVSEIPVHDSGRHSGNIFPGANQSVGNAYVDIGTIPEPASPATGNMRLYVEDQNGHPVVEVKGPAGLTRRLARDSIFIAKVDEAGGVVKGEAVYISGASGANELIQKARADSINTMPAVGIVLEDGALNAFVRVLFSGKATELNTNAFVEGDRVFVSATTAGALTTTALPHPNLRQRIGVVTRVNMNNGEIIVTPHIIRGDHEGTNQNEWKVGDAQAGAKSIWFVNANTGHLAWNPTADRTVHIPDGNGTLLTTAALSDHSHGDPTLALTNLSGTTASNSAGLTLSLSAGAGGAGDGGNTIAAGTRTASTSASILFSNENGISFGLDAPNGTRLTASHNALTSQSNQALSAANGSFAFQTASFSNANGVSFQTAAGSAIQASVAAGATATGNLGGIVGSNATYTSGTVTITGVGGGITVSSNTGQRIDLSVAAPVAQTNQTGGIYVTAQSTGQSSSSTYDLRTLSFVPDGIVSAGWSNGSFRVSATQSNQAFSADASSTFQTLSFQGTNNFSFSNNAGAIRASHNLAGTSTGFTGANISGSMTHNSSGLALSLSVAPGGGAGFSGGVSTGGNTLGSTGTVSNRIVFVGGANITLSQSTNALGDSATITISAPNPGGGAPQTVAYFNNMGAAGSVSKQSQATLNGSIVIVPLAPINDIFPGDITVATMGVNLRGGTTQSATAGTHRFFFGIYTRNVSTLSLLNSCSTSVTWPANATATQLLTGDRWLTIHSTNWSSSPVFTGGGRYWLAYMCSSSSQTQGFAWMGQSFLATTGRHGSFGVATTQSNSSFHGYPFMGRYTVANQSQFPAALSRSAISHGVAGNNFIPQIYFYDSNGLSAF